MTSQKEWKAQWMWGDASLIGHEIAKLNPMRWSTLKSAQNTISELQQNTAENSNRPVRMELLSGDGSWCYERFSDIHAALRYLQDLEKGEALQALETQADSATPEKHAGLMVLPPEDAVQFISWGEEVTVRLANGQSAVSILSLSQGTSSAPELCRLSLFGRALGDASFPLLSLTDLRGSATGHNMCNARGKLHVTIHSNCKASKSLRSLLPCNCLSELLPPEPRLVTFSVQPRETFEDASPAEARLESVAASLLGDMPQWVGAWSLDKSRSESYDPILADLGVNVLLRKAADLLSSKLIITKTDTHVTITIQIWVTVEDCLPIDGSWVQKDVPKGSSMEGTCRVRITKWSMSEIEMLTEFPEGHGDLRDTLTMNEDGKSFKRVVNRGSLCVTRTFTKDDTD
eukprot:TRINITY_DN81859_c0_g1_i1.p1 TRINITY_DN81859_c0_g1~~TRINITY_DN81859_c0_g1_i1.p1  ORF type:complete len:402 (-),score=77.52 TRINITY_DN81859_c0_g1_i1:67-1272(-)